MWEGLLLGHPSKQRPPELFIISMDSFEGPENDLRVPLCTALLGYSSARVMGRTEKDERVETQQSQFRSNEPHPPRPLTRGLFSICMLPVALDPAGRKDDNLVPKIRRYVL